MIRRNFAMNVLKFNKGSLNSRLTTTSEYIDIDSASYQTSPHYRQLNDFTADVAIYLLYVNDKIVCIFVCVSLSLCAFACVYLQLQLPQSVKRANPNLWQRIRNDYQCKFDDANASLSLSTRLSISYVYILVQFVCICLSTQYLKYIFKSVLDA